MSVRVVKPLNTIEKDSTIVFLAGPSVRPKNRTVDTYLWRTDVSNLLIHKSKDIDIVIANPEVDAKFDDWTLSRQIDWEVKYLNLAKVIIFWIPRDSGNPAFTTNIEFGEWMHSNKIVVGAPKDAERMDYIKDRCTKLGIPFSNTIEQTVDNAIKMLSTQKTEQSKMWFTADTHFGNERTLTLSKRPYSSVSEMGWDMVKRWNSVVSNNDTVFHLGDFGDASMVSHLNAKKIYLVPGNYDKPEILHELSLDSRVEVMSAPIVMPLDCLKDNDISKMVMMVHEPVYKSLHAGKIDFYLFGHIHNLQMVKKNGLNVGVDCHKFTPIDEETIKFYYTAIKEHYDENVFTGEVIKENV